MEEEKAAAYYDELSRKGEGAARFKQGLGFSSSSDTVEAPARGSALPSSSSFLSQFVRASTPTSAPKLEKDSEIRSIRDKLKKKPEDQRHSRVPERSERRRSRSKERDDRDRRHRRRSRSRSRSRERRRERERDDGERPRRRRSRSSSPRRGRRRSDDEKRGRKREEGKGERDGKTDYSKLIRGYDEMSAAEKVKAKMKLQLVETAEKDTSMGSGWERFEFDKDAPVDDEEVEAADDDAALVKRMGQSFRFSAIEARREEQIKVAHDEAMFGAPAHPISTSTEDVTETTSGKDGGTESNVGASLAATSLLSEKVLAKQQGSWRDRARKS